MSSPTSRVPAYQQRIGVFWWMHKRTYFMFVMRELSSLFVAWFVLYLLLFIAAVGRGQQSYEDFLDTTSNPVLVVVNVVAFAFVVLHVITWFALTPQAMDVRMRGQQVPGWVIIASQYVGLLVVSAFVYWLVTR